MVLDQQTKGKNREKVSREGLLLLRKGMQYTNRRDCLTKDPGISAKRRFWYWDLTEEKISGFAGNKFVPLWGKKQLWQQHRSPLRAL
jgi:hypothetical protein